MTTLWLLSLLGNHLVLALSMEKEEDEDNPEWICRSISHEASDEPDLWPVEECQEREDHMSEKEETLPYPSLQEGTKGERFQLVPVEQHAGASKLIDVGTWLAENVFFLLPQTNK